MERHGQIIKQVQPSFRHNLPKANEIVELDQQVKRSIYPFKMTYHRVNQSQSSSQPQKYQQSALQSSLYFKPPKPNVMDHFNPLLIIYDKFNNNQDFSMFNMNIFSIQKLKNLRNNDYMMYIEQTNPITRQDNLRFDSRFQSGNLSIASKVDQCYCLLLHNDVNTSGYTNWFYFSVKCKQPGTYKFAIMNYGKAGWPYNNGITICTSTVNKEGLDKKNKKLGWKRQAKNVNCQMNSKIYKGNHYFNRFNTLYFQFTFEKKNQQTFFAYNIPYTYTQLCLFLDDIQQRQYPYFFRKLAGRSLAGNRLQMITITNFEKNKNDLDIPVIVLLARAHSGQTVSSWVIQAFLQFIISHSPQAQLLRDNFVFKIFPMINPDGVIHGNYRCSLSGRDLNRRWSKPSKDIFPEVYYIKNQIIDISSNRPIKMILDFHGHSQKKKVFIYGCNDRSQPHKCRLFPYIFSKVCNHFEFSYCNFSMDKSKFSTARITLYNTLKVHNVFTIESSQYGIFEGHFNTGLLFEVGKSLGRALIMYFRPKPMITNENRISNKIKKKKANKNSYVCQEGSKIICNQQQVQVQSNSEIFEETTSEDNNIYNQIMSFYENSMKIQEQLLNNQQLLRLGNEADSGSERQPSVDNISYQKLAKMNLQKQIRHQKKKLSTQPKRQLSANPHRNQYNQANEYKKQILQKSETVKLSTRKNSSSEKCNNTSTNFKNTIKQATIQKKIVKPQSAQSSKRKQAVKMINFSLSIDDDASKMNRVLVKIPAAKKLIDWKYMSPYYIDPNRQSKQINHPLLTIRSKIPIQSKGVAPSQTSIKRTYPSHFSKTFIG